MTKPASSPSASIARIHGCSGAPSITAGNSASAMESTTGATKCSWDLWVRKRRTARWLSAVTSISRTVDGGSRRRFVQASQSGRVMP